MNGRRLCVTWSRMVPRNMGYRASSASSTARCVTGEYDFVSRFFSPHTGIPEDPVTGLGHCILTPYWAQKLDKDKFVAYQASARGGTVWCRLGKDRVYLGGKAVTLISGEVLRQ